MGTIWVWFYFGFIRISQLIKTFPFRIEGLLPQEKEAAKAPFDLLKKPIKQK